MKPYLQSFFLLTSLSLILLCSCNDESFTNENGSSSGRPLEPGEVCNISFINGVSTISEVTTRSIPEGKKSVLHDFTNQTLKGKDGKRAGWISGEVRTRYDEDVEKATTRSFNVDTQLFGKNSMFRMLVFSGPYEGTVNMSTPIANMVCQVNSTGNGASFISPSTKLEVLKGRYTFVCFPANEKYNTWTVGQTTGYEIPIGKDEDFVYMQLPDVDINNIEYQIDLSKFIRFGYQLTVKFSISEDLGYLQFPQDKLELTISDNGNGTNSVINTNATFDLKNNCIKDYNGNAFSFKDTLEIKGTAGNQEFTAVSNFLIANNSASQRLTISYPELTVFKPKGTEGSKEDSVFTIKPGTYTTSEEVQFNSGNSYTITLTIGEQVKGFIVGGVIWSPGNLDYNPTTNKFFWAPTPDKAATAREARGAHFRWMAPLAQNAQSSPSDVNPIQYVWKLTTPPVWNGNDLGNYDNYYKTIFKDKPELTRDELPSPLTVTSLGDPCWGMGKKWRLPTYNEGYLFCYVSPNAIPVGAFSTPRNSFSNCSKYSDVLNGNVTDEAARYAGIFITCSKKPNMNPAAITSLSQYDGSQLFLPAAGNSTGNNLYSTGGTGLYWCSTPPNGYSYLSYSFNFVSSGKLTQNSSYRSDACSVRCVLRE